MSARVRRNLASRLAGGPAGWAGAPLRRSEDPRFLRGLASYVADLEHHNALEVVFSRSPHASARIGSIDATPALAAGAVAVLDGAAVAARAEPIVMASRYAGFKPSEQPALAHEVVRYVGEPVAAVAAAGTRAAAEDLAELVRIEYEPLPPVVDLEAARQPGSPQVHPLVDRNVFVERTFTAGDFKRTVTLTDNATPEEVERYREQLRLIHEQFKQALKRHRPGVELARVATGEAWLAGTSVELGLGLVDRIAVSSDYLLERNRKRDLCFIEAKRKKGALERLKGLAARLATEAYRELSAPA